MSVSFMVAEGVLRDRMATPAEKAGIALVAGALGQTDALADSCTAPIACAGERRAQPHPHLRVTRDEPSSP